MASTLTKKNPQQRAFLRKGQTPEKLLNLVDKLLLRACRLLDHVAISSWIASIWHCCFRGTPR